MDTRIAPGGIRLDVVATDSATRVTPSSGIPFHEIVTGGASALLRGAQAAVSALPGAPIVAAAVRPGSAGPPASSPTLGAGALGVGASATGTVPAVPASVVQGSAESPLTTSATGNAETTALDGALAQSQQFNLYYLQLQEQLSAENRAYSAMSNVLKARHDTVKNAIGNIR